MVVAKEGQENGWYFKAPTAMPEQTGSTRPKVSEQSRSKAQTGTWNNGS